MTEQGHGGIPLPRAQAEGLSGRAAKGAEKGRTFFSSVTLCHGSLRYLPNSSFLIQQSLENSLLSPTSFLQHCQQTVHNTHVHVHSSYHLFLKHYKGQKKQALKSHTIMFTAYSTAETKQHHSDGHKASLQAPGLEASCTCCSSGDRNAPFKRSRAAEGSTNLRFDPIIRANKY